MAKKLISYDDTKDGLGLPDQVEAGLNATYARRESVGQADYVAQIERLLEPRTLTVSKKNATNELEILSSSQAGSDTAITLWGDGGKGRYQSFSTVTTTTGGMSTESGVKSTGHFADCTTTGVWSTAATPYTQEVGATFSWVTTVYIGDTVDFLHFIDNRGGVWHIEIVGTSTSATISTWNETTGYNRATLFTSPVAGTVTIRGTFQGADPDHAPSSGPARGWLAPTYSTNFPEIMMRVSGLLSVPKTDTLVSGSNKDLAIRVAPPGGSYEFIPYHGIETEERIDPPVFSVDGQVVDIGGASPGMEWEGHVFDVDQHFYGLNSTSTTPGNRVAEVWSRLRVHSSGRLSVQVRWKALTTLTSNQPNIFGMMLPVSGAIFDQIIASDGRSWPHTIGSTEATTDWVDEGDLIQSWAATSSVNPALIAAMTINAARDSLKLGDSRKGTGHTYISHRADGLVKVYPSMFSGLATIAEGEVFHISGELLYAALPGARNLLSR